METGRAGLQVKKFNMIKTSNIVLFQNFERKKNASSADEMGLDKVGMHHFSTLDAVGSNLYVADRSICNQDENVLITKTRSPYFEVLCAPKHYFVVNCSSGQSTSK